MFLLHGHYDFAYCGTWYIKSHAIPDIVYVPITWSLRFYILRYIKSHVIPDIVYVPTKWSLRFYVPRYAKSHATLHMLYTIFSTLVLFHSATCS